MEVIVLSIEILEIQEQTPEGATSPALVKCKNKSFVMPWNWVSTFTKECNSFLEQDFLDGWPQLVTMPLGKWELWLGLFEQVHASGIPTIEERN
ncbi:hypothetical protein U2F10_05520 [Leptothoe sp. EHU-05/26/07-4]